MSFNSSSFSRYAGRWLLITGAFELALAAAFAVGAVAVPFAGEGFWLTAGILGVTGGVLVAIAVRVRRSAAEAERILAAGMDGEATITSLAQTGMTLNENPQVRIGLSVRLPGREPYAAERTEFVPLILLGRLAVGATLSVTADPGDVRKVLIDWSGEATGSPGAALSPATAFATATSTPAPMAAATPSPRPAGGTDETLAQVHLALAESGLPAAAPFASAEQGGYTVEQLREVVRAVGIEGTATIDKLADTGETVGDERLFTMQVTLHVPGRSSKQLSPSAAMVPQHAASRVAIGKTVPVKVHAENDGLVLFDWERLQG